MRLDAKTLAKLKLPAGKPEAKFFDDDVPGFGVRLRAGGGAARWIFQYDIAGRTRRMMLGAITAVEPAVARDKAEELYHKVRLGADPAGDKAESQVRAAESFDAILRPYLAQQRGELKPLSYTQKERHLVKHCRSLHGLPLVKVDRRAIATKLTAVANKSGDVESNRVRASLSAFFNWCMAQGFADANPVVGTKPRKEKSRDHVLSDDDIKAIWNATAGDDDYSAIVRLLMMTGQRADEIGSLSWPEISDDCITLPGTRVKNGRDHVVPLSKPARAILQARPKMLGRDFVFGRAHSDGGFSGWSACKVLLDERIKAAGAKVKPWVNHDLRRTVATRMAEIGVAPHVVEAVLNHVSGHKAGVAGIYNRATYANEKRAALILWADHLLGIVEGKPRKVVPLRA
jgi:integrase